MFLKEPGRQPVKYLSLKGKLVPLALVFATALAGVAAAHKGVTNAAVMARMNGMSTLQQLTKTLGQMASGKTAFDGLSARMAAREMALEAGRVEGLFKGKEFDPKSEAKPEIWEDFADFAARARALEVAAQGAESVQDLDALKAAFGTIRDACAGCHKLYRIDAD